MLGREARTFFMAAKCRVDSKLPMPLLSPPASLNLRPPLPPIHPPQAQPCREAQGALAARQAAGPRTGRRPRGDPLGARAGRWRAGLHRQDDAHRAHRCERGEVVGELGRRNDPLVKGGHPVLRCMNVAMCSFLIPSSAVAFLHTICISHSDEPPRGMMITL